MKLVPIRGYIGWSEPPEKKEVDGYAFEVRDYEFWHAWVTPAHTFTGIRGWTTSQWESGCSIKFWDFLSDTPLGAAKKFKKWCRGQDPKELERKFRARLRDWYSGKWNG